MVVKITDQKMWMQVWCIPDHSWMSIEVKPCFTLGAEEELLNRPRLDCQITIVIGTDGVGMGQGSLVFFFVFFLFHVLLILTSNRQMDSVCEELSALKC